MSKIIKILALDLATKTGFATNSPARTSGVVDFSSKRGESSGMRYLKFSAWARDMIQIVQPSLIVSEKAHHRGGSPTEVAYGFATHLQSTIANINEERANDNKIDMATVHTGTLKKFATGKGNAGKQLMMDAFKEKWGRDPIDDNEADASFILDWAIEEFG